MASTFIASPTNHALWILRIGYTVLPIGAGLDKFFHILADWPKYLAPWAVDIVGAREHWFMYGVGIVEIAAGIGVAFMPRLFGYVVSLWLLCITLNLLFMPQYYDIALRDFGLALGALALARLASGAR